MRILLEEVSIRAIWKKIHRDSLFREEAIVDSILSRRYLYLEKYLERAREKEREKIVASLDCTCPIVNRL